MINQTPIPLRAHHLESLKFRARFTKETIVRLLHVEGYIPTKNNNHPFAKVIYDGFRKIMENPNSLIKVIEGQPDFICNACPLREKCLDSNHSPILGNAFQSEENPINRFQENKSRDKAVAKRYGFEIGKVYSLKEIKGRMFFFEDGEYNPPSI